MDKMGWQGLDCSPTSTCQWSQREREGKTIVLGFCSWRTSSFAWRTSWVREGRIEEKWLTKSWLYEMGLKCKRPSCCCCTLTLPLQNERATKTLYFSSCSTCSFKRTLFLLAGFCFLSESLERERENELWRERERRRERESMSYARVFGQLCLWA